LGESNSRRTQSRVGRAADGTRAQCPPEATDQKGPSCQLRRRTTAMSPPFAMKWRTASNLSRALPRNRSIAAVRLLRFRRRAFRPTASGPVTPFACPPVMEGSTTARCWSSPRASAMKLSRSDTFSRTQESGSGPGFPLASVLRRISFLTQPVEKHLHFLRRR
jgi:hypothetical protein